LSNVEASRARNPLRHLGLFKPPEERAFEQLYKRHAREIYQYALALTANPADAEDVTQTTFLNAYRAFQRGERPLKPHNWLITIAHNVCRMRWRQAGARPKEVALEEAPEPASPEDERPDLDEVLTALAKLSFNQRAALVMRELEGRSYQEISTTLGLSVSAVEALLFRARRRLQVNRKALGVLTTVPLPGSLISFLGAGGGAVAVGGTLIGADLVLKAAAVVAVGTATAGVGYKSVQAVTSPGPQQAQAQIRAPAPAHKPTASHASRAQVAGPTARRVKLRRAVATTASRSGRPTAPAGAGTGAGAAPSTEPQTPAGVVPAPPPIVLKPPVTVPIVPPPPPITVPQPKLPPLPPPPITVTTPILPPPPIK
jgi:RNA polymerase sigma factor (sigma-70 family)